MSVINKYTAKPRLLYEMRVRAREFELLGGYSDQLNRNSLYESIEVFEKLNHVQVAKVEAAIIKAENDSVEAAKKYGWNPLKVDPTDYIGFVPEELRG